MNLEQLVSEGVVVAIKTLFDVDLPVDGIALNETIKDYKGDLTVVVFPLTRHSKLSPEQTGQAIGEILKEQVQVVEDFNVIKGFLNLEINI